MSNCFGGGCGCGSSTPVKPLKPGDLDKEQSKKDNSESVQNKTSNNGGKCTALLRLFCSSKGERSKVKKLESDKPTKVKKLESDKPTVLSEDGAHCNPD